MKRLSVAIPGSGQIHDVEIEPGTTAGDVLTKLNLSDYLLSKGPNHDFFAKSESVYDKVNDGEKIFASTPAEVGGLTQLNIRYNPTLTRLSRVGALDHGPVQHVERQKIPYWQEHGWAREGDVYQGNFSTSFGAFQGWIAQRPHQIDFFLLQPSSEILNSRHGACFQPRNDGWYLVHMRNRPRDVSSGIIAVERVIAEAYRR